MVAKPEFEQLGVSSFQTTINVEYNQLDPLLRDTTSPDGDVNDDTGFSPFPGAVPAPSHLLALPAATAAAPPLPFKVLPTVPVLG